MLIALNPFQHTTICKYLVIYMENRGIILNRVGKILEKEESAHNAIKGYITQMVHKLSAWKKG